MKDEVLKIQRNRSSENGHARAALKDVARVYHRNVDMELPKPHTKEQPQYVNVPINPGLQRLLNVVASLQKLQGKKPDTPRDILVAGAEAWLKAHGYWPDPPDE